MLILPPINCQYQKNNSFTAKSFAIDYCSTIAAAQTHPPLTARKQQVKMNTFVSEKNSSGSSQVDILDEGGK